MDPLTRSETTGATSSSGAVLGAIHRAIDMVAITIPGSNIDCVSPNLFENREDYFALAVPLFNASITGDWETAKSMFQERQDLVRYGLTKDNDATIHVVARAKETRQTIHFMQNLVNMMTKEELELKNGNSNTAFSVASLCGHMKMAKIMWDKNKSLPDIRGHFNLLPLSHGALTGKPDIVKWLYDVSGKMTGEHWTNIDRDHVLYSCVDRGFFGLALQILKDHQEPTRIMSPLLAVLAKKPKAFDKGEKKLITRIIEPTCRIFGMNVEEDTDAHELLKIILAQARRTLDYEGMRALLRGHPTSFLNGIRSLPTERPTTILKGTTSFLESRMRIGGSPISYVQSRVRGSPSNYLKGRIEGPPSSGILFHAAEEGNTMFIVEVLRSYPDLMSDKNEDGLTIFHIAVMHRNQDIYNLLYEIGDGFSRSICILLDKNKNNMLHLVGKTSKEMATKMSGASLLMQRELLWFMEVEKIMPPEVKEEKNNDGQTPYKLFSNENEDLVAKGLKWMKDCMVVATLIVTVAFAAAFTVPGGYNQNHGLPFFIHQRTLLVFVIADAISLFSSSTSLLVFLSILTSRHDQSDFLYSLPRKLMTGLLTLLISVAAMMVTFSASFFVLYHKGLKWVPILIAAFTAVPVIVFAILQFPLLVDMFLSMYDSHYLFKPNKHLLYPLKPRSRSNNSPCWRFP